MSSVLAYLGNKPTGSERRHTKGGKKKKEKEKNIYLIHMTFSSE